MRIPGSTFIVLVGKSAWIIVMRVVSSWKNVAFLSMVNRFHMKRNEQCLQR